ncbi:Disease resistance protein RGA2 [Rhynchospora pubera]|uniref:Disease resistance protein RGA2 n=1 Tax=Rhynchospora pubera TaxID=906938 RepID=A0AAV8FB78_9POAL|nr:Disease resistance protein RGA2 [Rhynchospora pubera]
MAASAGWVVSPLITQLLSDFEAISGRHRGVVRDDMEAIKAVLVQLNFLIRDAEKKRPLQSAAAEIWLKKIRDAVYDTEDLLDDLRLKFHRNTKHKLLLRFNSLFYMDSIMGKEVKRMRKKLDFILLYGKNIEFGEEYGLSTDEVLRREREASSVFGEESLLIGRDKDKEQLLSLILSRGDVSNLISIVGLGGIGKTSLAKFVYQDDQVRRYFEMRLWIHVSMEFDLKKIGESILGQITGYRYQKHPDLWAVRRNLDEELYHKRCLIVLDDLWEQDAEKLDQLYSMLTSAPRHFCILVTTCSEKVALLMNSTVLKSTGLSGRDCRGSMVKLSGISPEDSWGVFSNCGLKLKQECDSSLKGIGMQIMEKYNGIPLVAKALGNSLRFKEESAWLDAKDGNFWNLVRDNFSSSLQLSYYKMPPDLKFCFIYFAVFPSSIPIEKDKLVRQWSVLGLIQPTRESFTPESIGDEYVDSLLSIYFLEPLASDARKVLVHNLVLDLARYYAGDEVLILDGSKKRNVNVSRYGPHYALLLGNSKEIQRGLLKRVRALHFSECTADLVNQALLETPYLRVLNLCGCSLTKVPSSIKQLQHLRYLDASYLPIETLPESIGKLTLLIYLDLSNCQNLKLLPGSLVNLKELHTLNLSYCGELAEIPRKMFENNVSLVYLLMKGCPAYSNFSIQFLKNLKIYEGCLPAHHIKQLENLDQISGDLELEQLEKATLEDARSANLCRKSGVHALKLHWTAYPVWGTEESVSDEEMLFNLQPSRKLKHFHIDGFRAAQYPGWLMDIRSSLPELEMICISNLPKCDHLPPLGQLPNLQELRLSNLPKIETIEWDCYSGKEMFGRLKRLFLHDLSNLREWSFKEPLLLNEVEVVRCPLLSFKPCMPESISWKIDDSSLVLSSENSLGQSPHKSATTTKIKINGCYPSSDGWRALENLTALQILEISSCDTLTTLPQSIRALTNLSSLKITNCHDLAELPEWIIELTSLRELQIRECFRLKIFPDSVKHIPMLTLDKTLEEFESYVPYGSYITPMKETELSPPREEQLSFVSDMEDFVSDVEDPDFVSWTCLENVKSTELEEMTNICNQPKITSVKLHWTTALDRSGEATIPDDALLEELQPHSNLQHLKLDGYMARELASWFMNIDSNLPNLVQLNLCNLAKCDHLPPLGQLRKLSELRIWNLPNLKKIDYDFFGGGEAFSQLTILSLGHMLNLEEWEINSVVKSGEDMPLLFIDKLEVIRCPKLVFKPILPGSNHFTIEESTKALSYSGQPTVSFLYYLKIRDCGLSFDGWNRLQLVNGLKEMVIDSCQDLKTLPESMRSLTSLESLDITSCKNIAWLPEWLEDLLSLRVLHIHECYNLSRLPDCLQNLSSLKTLRVVNCSSMLVARCMREDKIKISHIPRVFIEEDGGQEVYWNNIDLISTMPA